MSSPGYRQTHAAPRILIVLLACATQTAAFAEPAGAGELGLSELQLRIARIQERTAELAGDDDLLDTLHFGWLDRPYARATLAVLVKTSSILQRELRLRRRDNGAIPDSTMSDMLGWAERALDRAAEWESNPGFMPDRVRVTGADFQAVSSTPALFTFLDRATSTRADRILGDLDLAAAAGFRLYARMERDMGTPDAIALRGARAGALGMATVLGRMRGAGRSAESTGSGGGGSSRGDVSLVVEGLGLRELLGMSPGSVNEPRWSAAIVDPPFGESWASSLARRALARGVLGRQVYTSLGWTPRTVRRGGADRGLPVAAAVWVDAMDGQSVGLLAGWRDLRDGSASMYPSVLTSPRVMEAVAHAALDVLRLGRYIEPLRSRPSLAVAVGGDAVDANDDNAWARWIEPVWEALLRRQIRFDVIPRSSEDAARRLYAVVLSLRAEDVADIASLLVRIERNIAKSVPEERISMVRELDGTIAGDVYFRHGRVAGSRWCAGLVNLSGEPRRLKLSPAARFGALRDVITGERIDASGEAVSLLPWQTRLLQPVE